MIRPYILAESNWKAIKETRFELAILPWGACEAHNFHLPYSTDIIEAEHIAAEAARIVWDKGQKIIVLPVIPFGVNTGQHDVARGADGFCRGWRADAVPQRATGQRS